jgi:hypothetical protein
MSPPIAIRRADAQDVETVARLYRTVRDACLPYLPRLHNAQEALVISSVTITPLKALGP